MLKVVNKQTTPSKVKPINHFQDNSPSAKVNQEESGKHDHCGSKKACSGKYLKIGYKDLKNKRLIYLRAANMSTVIREKKIVKKLIIAK